MQGVATRLSGQCIQRADVAAKTLSKYRIYIVTINRYIYMRYRYLRLNVGLSTEIPL